MSRPPGLTFWRRLTGCGLSVGALALGALSNARGQAADEWPQWGGGPPRNPVSATAHDLPLTWNVTSGAGVRWAAELGDNAYGNPVLAGGRLFVGTNNEHPRDASASGDRGVVMCFAADSGKFLWQDSYEKLSAGNSQDWELQGICSSPAVAGETVYYLNNRGQLVAADVQGFGDGENDGPWRDEPGSGPQQADIRWRYDLIAELGVVPHYMSASNPLVVGPYVYVVTSNGVDEAGESTPNPRAPSVVCLDRVRGKLVWAEASPDGPQHRVRMRAILDGQWSSLGYHGPVPSKGPPPGQILFAGGDGWLYALEAATGRLVWRLDGNLPEATWHPSGRGDRNYFLATPVVAEGRVYVALGQDPEHGSGPGRLLAVDPGGRGEVTSTHLHWDARGPAFGRSMSTVTVEEGVVYAAELDGFLRALDSETGRELWQYDLLATVWGSPLVADGKVYLGDEDGDLVVLQAGRELKLLGEENLGDAIYGMPIAAGHTLYVATKSRLFALEKALLINRRP